MKSKLFNYRVRFGVSSNVIKVIAILIMTFDHFCKIILYWLANNVLYNSQNFRLIYKLIFSVFYEIGQMAFPLFAFLLVQGFLHTKNIYKYFFSLLSFGFISEIFFFLAFYNNLVYLQHQNVFFTLSFGLLLLFTLKKVQLKFNNDFLSNFAIQATLCCLFMFLSFILNFDHGVRGLLLILIFYYFRNCRLISLLFFLLLYCLFHSLNIYLLFPCIIILLYNGKRGKKKFKYLFYFYYPLHLIVLYIVKILIIFQYKT